MSSANNLKLMTWMATNRDPRFLENVIYALEKRTGKKVDTVYYLYGSPATDREKVIDILGTVQKFFKGKVKLEPIDAGTFNSSDHDEVMKHLMKALEPRLNSMGDICVNISSGTPTMSTIWMVLKAMDFFRGKATYYSAQKYQPSIHKSDDVVPKEKQVINAINFDAAISFLREIKKANTKGAKGNSLEDTFLGFNSRSPLRQRAFEKILKYSEFDNVPMLILGERGVGKSSAVKNLIQKIKKRDMIEAVCGLLDSNLADSMLFGHKKGAFTGANEDHKGFIEEAEKKVLFLDEIQDLPRSTQRKLLRTIQEKDHPYRPLGSKTEMKANVQFIFATNNTMEQIREKLDPDFLDRISIYTVRIPSLRECKVDIQDDWQAVWNSCRPQESRKDSKVIPETAPWSDCLQEFFENDVNLTGNIRSLQKAAYQILAWGVWDDPQKTKELLDEIQRENTARSRGISTPECIPTTSPETDSLDTKPQGKSQPFDIENFPEFQNCSKKEAERLFRKRLAEWAHEKYGTYEKAAEALDCTRETLVKS